MKAVIPVIDETREKSYYLQVYDYIKKAVLNGDITEGEKLPSLRSLSKSTGLSITTIEQAYNQLTVEGYIYSKAQSGYYVDSVFTYLNRTVSKKILFHQRNCMIRTTRILLNYRIISSIPTVLISINGKNA
ncbi:MAG: winged helix-turn-helix domain-containing protein [Anaerovoracaceae bacterium]